VRRIAGDLSLSGLGTDAAQTPPHHGIAKMMSPTCSERNSQTVRGLSLTQERYIDLSGRSSVGDNKYVDFFDVDPAERDTPGTAAAG
jgi:hypothetical protein